MSTDPRDPANQRAEAAAVVNTAIHDAKGVAATAIAAAATNAGKTGWNTSEFWAGVGAAGVSVLAIALKAAAVVPGPWQIPAVVVGAGLAAGGYALARGQVKKAALAAAGAMVAEAVPLALGTKTAGAPASSPTPR